MEAPREKTPGGRQPHRGESRSKRKVAGQTARRKKAPRGAVVLNPNLPHNHDNYKIVKWGGGYFNYQSVIACRATEDGGLHAFNAGPFVFSIPPELSDEFLNSLSDGGLER